MKRAADWYDYFETFYESEKDEISEIMEDYVKNYSDFHNVKIDIHTPKELRDFLCKKYNISLEELKSKRRLRYIVIVRQIYCYLCRYFWSKKRYTLAQIGIIVGYHYTNSILTAINTIQNLISTDKQFKIEIEDLIENLHII